MKTALVTLLAVVVLGLAAAAALMFSGSYNFAADEPHWGITEKLIASARHHAIDRRASEIEVPDDLDNPARLRRGAAHYQPMCAGCHLAPGMDDTELRAGLYPQPPALTEHGIHNAASAFWTIKHGIKMSGMPAWGASHDDESLWDMVALLKTLPGMTEEEWKILTGGDEKSATPTGHEHHDHAH